MKLNCRKLCLSRRLLTKKKLKLGISLICINLLLILLLHIHKKSFNSKTNAELNEELSHDLINWNLLPINRHRYPIPASIVLNNEHVCNKSKNVDRPFVQFLINSHPSNFVRRQAIRDTCLSSKVLNIATKNERNDNISIQTVEIGHIFLLGNSNDPIWNDTIYNEAQLNNDIIVIESVENYKNILRKHLAALKWIVDYCSSATFVVKIDDDVFVNIYKLVEQMLDNLCHHDTGTSKSCDISHSKFMYCNMKDQEMVVRDQKSKWYINYTTYPFERYPKYCSGFAYITNVPTIREMMLNSKNVPTIGPDDVYVTGLLLHNVENLTWYEFKSNSTALPFSLVQWSFSSSNKTHLLFDSLLTDAFIILHTHAEQNEFNYTIHSTDLEQSKGKTVFSFSQSGPNGTFMMMMKEIDSLAGLMCSESIYIHLDPKGISQCESIKRTYFECFFYTFYTELWRKIDKT